jgi:hypothetical protein
MGNGDDQKSLASSAPAPRVLHISAMVGKLMEDMLDGGIVEMPIAGFQLFLDID